jgi:pyrroline-5-carboxylate reductase
VDFNNERIVAECDIVFLCVLPFQAPQVLKEVRALATQRAFLFTETATKFKKKQSSALMSQLSHLSPSGLSSQGRIRPLFVSCLSATTVPKLRQMLCEESVFLRTLVNVPKIKADLFRS